MGRKKIPTNLARRTISCSLKPVTIEKMEEAISNRANRSLWIESAIKMKLDGWELEHWDKFSQRRLLVIVLNRLRDVKMGKYPENITYWNMDQDNTDILELISEELK